MGMKSTYNTRMIEDNKPIIVQDAKFTGLSGLGKNQWWRYFLSIFIILTIWQVIGAVPYAIFYLSGLTLNVYVNYLAISFSFVAFFAAIIVCVRLIHERPVGSLISSQLRLDWRMAFSGFVIWGIVSIFSAMGDALIHPGSYRWTFEWPGWLWFTLLAIPLTTIQTSAEEFFFRGYLLQGMARIISSKMALAVVSGFIFMVPHFFNPEMGAGFILLALFYFGFGFFLTLLTLYINSLDMALGIHAANNLFAVIIANYRGSSLRSIPLFTSAGIDPVYNLISLLVGAAILWFVIRNLGRSRVQTVSIPNE